MKKGQQQYFQCRAIIPLLSPFFSHFSLKPIAQAVKFLPLKPQFPTEQV